MHAAWISSLSFLSNDFSLIWFGFGFVAFSWKPQFICFPPFCLLRIILFVHWFVSINWAAAISFHCSFTHTHTHSLFFSPSLLPFSAVRYVILVWTWLCTAQTNAEQTNVAVLLSMQKHCKTAYGEREWEERERECEKKSVFYDKISQTRAPVTQSAHTWNMKSRPWDLHLNLCITYSHTLSLSVFVCVVDLIQCCLNFATVCCDVLHSTEKETRMGKRTKKCRIRKGTEKTIYIRLIAWNTDNFHSVSLFCFVMCFVNSAICLLLPLVLLLCFAYHILFCHDSETC